MIKERLINCGTHFENDQIEAVIRVFEDSGYSDMYEALKEICRTYRIEPDSKPENWDARGLTGWAIVLKALAKVEGRERDGN